MEKAILKILQECNRDEISADTALEQIFETLRELKIITAFGIVQNGGCQMGFCTHFELPKELKDAAELNFYDRDFYTPEQRKELNSLPQIKLAKHYIKEAFSNRGYPVLTMNFSRLPLFKKS